jgi:Malate synthase
MDGQINLRDAVRRTIDFTDPGSGKSYALNDDPAVLIVRARGLHLDEAHMEVDGEPIAGAFFDFALYLMHNHAELKRRGTGPYFYLPKLETRGLKRGCGALVIRHCEEALGIDAETVRRDRADRDAARRPSSLMKSCTQAAENITAAQRRTPGTISSSLYQAGRRPMARKISPPPPRGGERHRPRCPLTQTGDPVWVCSPGTAMLFRAK